jgi:CRISPR-associated protein Csh2
MKVSRSDLLLHYDSKFCIPNGDPFTGEQRFDEATRKVLVSDVRIKRYFRDQVLDLNKTLPEKQQYYIYVRDVSDSEIENIIGEKKKMTSSALQIEILRKVFENDPSVMRMATGKKKAKEEKTFDVKALLTKCIDVRLFGGLATEEKANCSITGPIQFANLNPSLNQVSLLDHQNTSVFKSDICKNQGSIGTTSLVPYSINQIVGWVNALGAEETGLTEEEVIFMLGTLWDGINLKNTRSKSNQSSLLIVKLNHENPFKKTSDLDSLITIKEESNTDIRSLQDVTYDFSKLALVCQDTDIKTIDYRCTNPLLSATFMEQMKDVKKKLKSF